MSLMIEQAICNPPGKANMWLNEWLSNCAIKQRSGTSSSNKNSLPLKVLQKLTCNLCPFLSWSFQCCSSPSWSPVVSAIPPMNATTQWQGKPTSAPCVLLVLIWPRTAPPPPPPSVNHAKETTSQRRGTTCPGVYTAAHCARRTWRWRQSAQLSVTGSVGAKRDTTRLMTSASDTQSARLVTEFSPKVGERSLLEGYTEFEITFYHFVCLHDQFQLWVIESTFVQWFCCKKKIVMRIITH